MTQPVFLLFSALLLFAAAVFAFRFRYKIKKEIKKYSSKSERILVEDALKHFYDYEYKNMEPSLDSLAGNLNISDNHAARLVNKLSGLGLLEIREEKMRLTSGGKSYALKVIRIHRLWERYLAEETSVPVEDWHNDAEFKEHNITEKEAEDLSALLGNPIYDPHGDPIPSKNGDIPDYTGIQLNSLNENEYAIITHVEDEPKEIYQQITAFGLRRGMQIRVLQKNNIKITFDAEGEEIILALPFAQNITVKKIEDEKLIQSEFETLDSLQMNDEAVVVEISKALIGQQRRRLLDLGIVPGTKIKAVLQGAGKDPTAYLVRETTIALRKSISKWIYIKKEKSNAA